MTSPLGTSLDKDGHRHYIWKPTQEKFISVTTAIECGMPKPALPYWAARLVAKAAVETDDWTELIKPGNNKDAINYLSSQPQIYTAGKAKIGDLVHNAIEDYIRFERRPLTKSPEVEIALDQFEKFFDVWKPVFTHTECTVYSRSLGYAGTADDFIEINGVPLVIDVKSGKGVWPEAAVQMSAYKNADFIGINNEMERKLPTVEGGAILHVSPEANSYQFIPVYIGDEVFDQFLRALDTYKFNFLFSKEKRILFRHITKEKSKKLNEKTPEWVLEIWRDKIHKRKTKF